MVRSAGLAAVILLLGACADESTPLEPAPLSEVCGAAGPFQLLSLAADERAGVDSRTFAVIGDRLLFVAGKGQRFLSPAYGPLPETSTVYAVGPCGRYSNPRRTLPLVRFFFDGRKPQTLASRATRAAVIREDGRILTMVDVDDDWLGELTQVDPSTKAARRIDDRVVAAQFLDWWRHPTEPDAIVYGVVDGDRSGVWLARPAPVD